MNSQTILISSNFRSNSHIGRFWDKLLLWFKKFLYKLDFYTSSHVWNQSCFDRLKKDSKRTLIIENNTLQWKILITGHNNCGTRNSLSSREKKSEIHIKIGKPKLHPDSVIRWYCPLQIIGIGSEKVHGAFGSDSIRAIEMAFQMAGLLLVRDIQKLYNLNWLKPEHLYFPPPNNLEELSKNEIHLQKN